MCYNSVLLSPSLTSNNGWVVDGFPWPLVSLVGFCGQFQGDIGDVPLPGCWPRPLWYPQPIPLHDGVDLLQG